MVGFFDAVFFEEGAEFCGGVGVFGEEEEAAGGAVKAVDGEDVLADLVAENFHGDLVVGLGVVGRVNELARGFVDGDEGGVLV